MSADFWKSYYNDLKEDLRRGNPRMQGKAIEFITRKHAGIFGEGIAKPIELMLKDLETHQILKRMKMHDDRVGVGSTSLNIMKQIKDEFSVYWAGTSEYVYPQSLMGSPDILEGWLAKWQSLSEKVEMYLHDLIGVTIPMTKYGGPGQSTFTAQDVRGFMDYLNREFYNRFDMSSGPENSKRRRVGRSDADFDELVENGLAGLDPRLRWILERRTLKVGDTDFPFSHHRVLVQMPDGSSTRMRVSPTSVSLYIELLEPRAFETYFGYITDQELQKVALSIKGLSEGPGPGHSVITPEEGALLISLAKHTSGVETLSAAVERPKRKHVQQQQEQQMDELAAAMAGVRVTAQAKKRRS